MFIAGITFIILILPLLQGLSDIFVVSIEVFKAKQGVKIANYNSQVVEINSRLEPSSPQAIGFQMSNEEPEFIDDEEEDNRSTVKLNNKIGFSGGIIK
jgi:ABC-type Na+ efflux pump permease subunit